MSLRVTCHHFESKNPNECPIPMCDPGLPSADSPLREAPQRSLWSTRGHWECPHCLPGSPHLLCFRPAADWGQRSELLPGNQPFLPLSLLIRGTHHVTSLSLRLSLAHSLTTYWQKKKKKCFWLDAIRSFVFSIYSLPNSHFPSIVLSTTSIEMQYKT